MWVKSRGWKRLHNPSVEDYTPFVSVVVPTYNEEDTIVYELRKLMEQDYPNMEIIVVDDASEDRTVELIKKFVKDNGLSAMLIRQKERKGKASALNEAFKHCSGEIVVITDADTVLKENAIKQVIQNFRDSKVGAVTGRLSMLNYEQTSATTLEKSYRNVFDILRLGESCIDSTPVFNGPLVVLRKNLFDCLEPRTLADDTEISLRIREKGYRAIFDPRATVYALTPKSFEPRMKQKIRRAQGIIESFCRHRKMLFNPTYGKYGLIIFPCEFFMHIVSPILLVLAAALFMFVLAFTSIPLTYFMIIISLGIIVSLLTFVASRYVTKDRTSINLIMIFLTFLEHQVFLMLGLLFLHTREVDAKWEKIED
jgi:cellulose synthase/poly-beta-1,6-N-acetylglucosamine synthase-like glycosyltransferase